MGWELAQHVLNDLADCGCRAAKVQAVHFIQGSTPWRCDKGYDASIVRKAAPHKESDIVAVEEFDARARAREVATGEFKDVAVRFKSNAFRIGQVTQYPVQSVAGTSKQIDHDKLIQSHPCRDGGNIESNTIRECVTSALNRSATKEPNAAGVPFTRRHSVNADVVGVSEAIKSVLLHFREGQDLIAFRALQQQG